MSYLAKLNNWIETAYEPCKANLPIVRIAIALVGLLSTPRFLWLGDMPDSFFYPRIGLPMLFTGFPDPTTALILEAANICLWILLAFGLFTFPVSLALGTIQLVGSAFAFSLGKLDHALLGELVLFAGGFAGWGCRYSIDSLVGRKGRPDQSWPLCIFAVVISCAMFTAAIPKAASGWLDFETQSTLGNVMKYHFASEANPLLSGLMVDYLPWLGWELLDWGTVLWEACFVFFMWRLSLFRFACFLAVLFHLGVYLSMEIFFKPNLIAYSIFVPWSEMGRSLGQLFRIKGVSFARFMPTNSQRAQWIAIATALVGTTIWLLLDNPVEQIVVSLGATPKDWVALFMFSIALLACAWASLRFLTKRCKNAA